MSEESGNISPDLNEDEESKMVSRSVHMIMKRRYYICDTCKDRYDCKDILLKHLEGRCKKLCPDCKNPRFITEIGGEQIYKCCGSCKSDHQLKA